MRRIIVVTFALSVAAPLLAGCAGGGGGGGSYGGSYAPYDNSATCGVMGTCQPDRTRPYDMHGNYGGG